MPADMLMLSIVLRVGQSSIVRVGGPSGTRKLRSFLPWRCSCPCQKTSTLAHREWSRRWSYLPRQFSSAIRSVERAWHIAGSTGDRDLPLAFTTRRATPGTSQRGKCTATNSTQTQWEMNHLGTGGTAAHGLDRRFRKPCRRIPSSPRPPTSVVEEPPPADRSSDRIRNLLGARSAPRPSGSHGPTPRQRSQDAGLAGAFFFLSLSRRVAVGTMPGRGR